jgi:dTMP kinase
MRPGFFVVLEGGDGTGKSTQARLLTERLHGLGRPAFATHEPGGTARGARIREFLLHDHEPLDARAELLLMLADRAQHVAEIIGPRLAQGDVVVCDRYTPSTLVYQGIGRRLGVEAMERLCDWATGAVNPDLVIVLDLPDALAELRAGDDPDRLEQAGLEFHRAVRDGYRMLAPLYEWALVDASGTVDEVSERVWEILRPLLP